MSGDQDARWLVFTSSLRGPSDPEYVDPLPNPETLTVGQAVWLIEEIVRLSHELATSTSPDAKVQVAWERRHNVLFDAPGFVGLERFAKYELASYLTVEAAWEFRRRLAKLTEKRFLDNIDAMLLADAVNLLGQSESPLDHKTPPPEAPPTAASPDASGKPGPAPNEPPDLVTLNQAAGMVHRHKRTLERYKSKGTLPAPAVEGGGGKPDLFDWRAMRPWLESEFNIKLPEAFPANRRHA